MRYPFSALLDASTQALLFLSSRIPLVVFLNEAIGETDHVPNVNYPNYTEKFPLERIIPQAWPHWTWNDGRIFTPTPEKLIDARLTDRARLALKKSQLLADIVNMLCIARYPAWNVMPMQDVVYAAKQREAQRCKDLGGEDALEFPLVAQYADLAGLSLAAAADEILLKASFDQGVLLKSEYFRLKYLAKLKAAQDLAELDAIGEEFGREFFKNFEKTAGQTCC